MIFNFSHTSTVLPVVKGHVHSNSERVHRGMNTPGQEMEKLYFKPKKQIRQWQRITTG
jgi:hypothetical protein